MLSTRVVTTMEEFESLAGPWNELLRRSSADNIFLTWEWLYTWATHYLGGHQLYIVLVYMGAEQLVGIAPFYVHRARKFGTIIVRDMRFLGTEEVGSAYLDFIASEKHKGKVVELTYRHLHEEARTVWDTLTLSEIPCESSTFDLWYECTDRAGKVMDLLELSCCPVVHLTGRVEDVLTGIGRNQRYNLQRKMKRLKRDGKVTYEQHDSSQDMGKSLDRFMQLHRIRWDRKGSGGAFRRPRFLNFHREFVRICGQRGWARFEFLLLDGEEVAGVYAYTYGRRYYFYLPGFNPAISPKASTGVLLLAHCIEQAIGNGHQEFDLLHGRAEYKSVWSNRLRRSLTLRQYNRRMKAAACKAGESAKGLAKVLLR